MTICKQCVLDDRFPGIDFDEAGVCGFCRAAKDHREQRELKEKTEQRFRQLVLTHKGKSSYDCLVAYSGGKDSTYTLHLMKKKYDLKVLAYSFNNWFQSDAAVRNIRAMVQRFDIDHVMISPPYEQFKQLVLLSNSKELYTKKALERASAICITCISFIRYIGFKMALEKKIPFVVLGMTPGQASAKAALVKMNADMLIRMQQASFQPILSLGIDFVKPYLLKKSDFGSEEDAIYNVNPLSFYDYHEDAILAAIQEWGWVKPQDTDPNSTNCLLNAYANQVHFRRYGFNPYALEIAGLVREGCMSREEGLAKLSGAMNSEVVSAVRTKLGITEENNFRREVAL